MNKRALSVLAAMAMVVGALAAAPPAAAVTSTGNAYVAFGDSEAAGTGNLLYVQKAPCLRSRISYPLILGGTSYACASASTDATLDQVQTAAAAGKLGASTKLVTVTAGVNNLPWQQILVTCAASDLATCQAAIADAGDELAGVGPGIVAIVTTIRSFAPTAKILVTGYPLLFGDVATTCNVGWLNGARVTVPAAQTVLANQAVGAVNLTIQTAVTQFGGPKTAYLDLATTFDGHGLCDTGTRWVNGVIGLPLLSDGNLHVNSVGQFAIAAAVLRNR